MSREMDVRAFTSSSRKLVRFFHASRNGWKRKCLEAKRSNKLLQNQVRAVEASREQWKRQARDQRDRIRELEAELQKISAAD